ncbi:MAG: T9SS type B sorting domain-containing protein, partial [Sphingobacteriales bacterium]
SNKNGDNIAVGQSTVVSYQVQVNNDLTGLPTITNMVNVTAPSVNKNSNRADIQTECIAPVEPATVTLAATQICAGTTNTLTVSNPDAALTYRYYTQASGGTAVGQGNSFTTPQLSATTIYYVEAVRNAGQCVSALRKAVTVEVLPILAIPVVNVASVTPNSVTFSWAAVAGATGYEVSYNNGGTWQAPSSGTTGTTTTVSALAPNQVVSIRVRANGTLACQQSGASPSVTGTSANPLGDEVYIPNAFSPNGDGKNDVFEVYGVTVSNYRMEVYNQWGQMIYRSDNALKGWDGTYKGVLQPSGVYVYKINVVSQNGKEVLKKGTITLVR